MQIICIKKKNVYTEDMNIYISLFLVALIPPCVTLFLPKNKAFFNQPIIRGFGLGVYGALIIMLLWEGVEHGGIVYGGIWFVVGLLLSALIGFFVKEFHHHHEPSEKAHAHSEASMFRLLVSDFFHNIVDGIALAASFATSPSIGLASFLGILGHQVIQQGGQQILLVESGMKPKRAVMISGIVSLSVFLGLISMGESFEVMFICLSAGIVLWKVWTDIRHTTWNKKTILGCVIGAVVLVFLLLLVPHEH